MKKPLIPAHIAQGSVPAQFTSHDASALQALAQGKANDGQQKRALDWIMKEACGLPLWPYRESQRETDVALGRHFVGHQIAGVLKINISQLAKLESRGDSSNG